MRRHCSLAGTIFTCGEVACGPRRQSTSCGTPHPPPHPPPTRVGETRRAWRANGDGDGPPLHTPQFESHFEMRECGYTRGCLRNWSLGVSSPPALVISRRTTDFGLELDGSGEPGNLATRSCLAPDAFLSLKAAEKRIEPARTNVDINIVQSRVCGESQRGWGWADLDT